MLFLQGCVEESSSRRPLVSFNVLWNPSILLSTLLPDTTSPVRLAAFVSGTILDGPESISRPLRRAAEANLPMANAYVSH